VKSTKKDPKGLEGDAPRSRLPVLAAPRRVALQGAALLALLALAGCVCVVQCGGARADVRTAREAAVTAPLSATATGNTIPVSALPGN